MLVEFDEVRARATASAGTAPATSTTVLLIATRPLGAPVTGRKVVLQTIVTSLVSLGYRVVVAAFGHPDGDRTGEDLGAAEVLWLQGPAPHQVAASAVGRRRGWSLNELLWWSPRSSQELRAFADTHGVDLVVADGVRTARYAEELGLPWFCDLDDLLSDRYQGWADRDLRLSDIVGFRAPRSAALLRLLGRFGAAPVLRREAARLRRREVEVASAADGVSLVSAHDAATLRTRSGRGVTDLPMAVSVDVQRDWREHDPADRRLAFTGALNWWPNLEAVTFWSEELHPELLRRGLTGYELHVYGDAPESARSRLDGRAVVLHGRKTQPELRTELSGYPLLLVPQREAMGLTTKIIEAALIGTVVLSTRLGASGMSVEDRREVLLFDDVDELEAQLRWVSEHPEELPAIADRARRWAAAHYSAAAVADRWRLAFQDAFPDHPPTGSRPGPQQAEQENVRSGEIS